MGCLGTISSLIKEEYSTDVLEHGSNVITLMERRGYAED